MTCRKILASFCLGAFFMEPAVVDASCPFPGLAWWAENPPRAWRDDVAVASDGRIFVVGDFRDTVDFDPGLGQAAQTAQSSPLGCRGLCDEQYRDSFVLLLGSPSDDGLFQWVSTWGTNTVDHVRAVTLSQSGALLVAGTYRDSLSIGNDVLSTSHFEDQDGYLARLDPVSGGVLWARSFGETQHDEDVIDIDAGSDGSVFVASGEWGYLRKWDIETAEQTWSILPLSAVNTPLAAISATSDGGVVIGKNHEVARLNAAGTQQWRASFNSSGIGSPTTRVRSMAVAHSEGAVFVLGQFSGMVDFDPGSGAQWRESARHPTTFAYTLDLFLLRLGLDGTLQWVVTIGGGALELAQKLAISTQTNSCFVIARVQSPSAAVNPPGATPSIVGGPGYHLLCLRFDGSLAASIPFDEWTSLPKVASAPDGSAIIAGGGSGPYGGNLLVAKMAFNAPLDDPDADGILEAMDNCPAFANPQQVDGDGDGVGDSCDNCPVVANPDQADWNQDCLGNACDDALPMAGDCDGSGDLAVADIPCFIEILLDGNGDPTLGDVNADGVANGLDVRAFVESVLN